MPCVLSPLSETGENDGPDTYETVLHTYACHWGRAGVGPYGVKREIACWPGLELFKYAWGPSVVALGHSSKCMVSVIMKRLVSFFMYDRVWFGARHWGRHRGFKTNWHNVRWSLGAFTARTFLETVFSSYALVLLAQPTRSHEKTILWSGNFIYIHIMWFAWKPNHKWCVSRSLQKCKNENECFKKKIGVETNVVNFW